MSLPPLRKNHSLAAIALLFAVLWTAPVSASLLTASWDYDFDPFIPIDPSPFYDCSDWGAGGLFCQSLWDQGLEVTGLHQGLPMYGDVGPFFDAYGLELPVAVFHIAPKCLAGVDPCFDTFTPISAIVEASSQVVEAGAFFVSSKGGLIRTSNTLVDFRGWKWTDITSMTIGLYAVGECYEDGCPNSDQDLLISRLTFETDKKPIPEPASLLLLGTGVLALVRRNRRRAVSIVWDEPSAPSPPFS